MHPKQRRTNSVAEHDRKQPSETPIC